MNCRTAMIAAHTALRTALHDLESAGNLQRVGDHKGADIQMALALGKVALAERDMHAARLALEQEPPVVVPGLVLTGAEEL